MLVIIPVSLIFVSFLVMFIYLGPSVSRREQALKKRLKRVGGSKDIRQLELAKTIPERLVWPLLKFLARRLVHNMPSERWRLMRQALLKAGDPWGMGPGELLVLKGLLALVIPLLLFTGALITYLDGFSLVLATLCGALVGWYIPNLQLKLLTGRRVERLSRTLPDILDLLTVSVEAGLSFDGAMSRVAEKEQGPIGQEFQSVLREVMLGKPRHEALKNMAERLGVDELTGLVSAVVRAETLGMGLAGVLRQFSDQMRLRRKQRLEEAAMKAPVKMLLPLVFLIMPAVFVILLGPAIIQILEVLSP